MKLLIDIPYEAYYTFKCDLGKGNLNALAKIVANGTPYNPTGDCISREALIREIGRTDEWYKGRLICDIIDNAPTVEPERTQGNQITWEHGYECGYHQAKEDAIRRIAEQYSAHHELIPKWLSIGDMKGGAE